MYVSFKEKFNLPIEAIFPYFETPSDWSSLYGAMRPAKVLKNGWHSIPLKKFPFPLVAKNVELRREQKVRWIFGGFWRGVGEVNFSREGGETVIEGYEYICPYGLWVLSPLVEERFMEKEFKRIWDLGKRICVVRHIEQLRRRREQQRLDN